MTFPRMSGNAWVCTIITLILLASGIEQGVRALTKKEEPPKPQPVAAGPQLGDVVPDFTLPEEKGGKLSLATYRGKPLIVGFFCGCNMCKEIAKPLSDWGKPKKIPMIGLVTFKPEYTKEFRKETGIQYPLAYDEGKEVGAKWDSLTCPRFWVVDAKGRAVWTNPQMPDMMPPHQTAYFVKQAYLKPVPPARPKPPVATMPPGPTAPVPATAADAKPPSASAQSVPIKAPSGGL